MTPLYVYERRLDYYRLPVVNQYQPYLAIRSIMEQIASMTTQFIHRLVTSQFVLVSPYGLCRLLSLYCGHSLTLLVASHMTRNHNALIRAVDGPSSVKIASNMGTFRGLFIAEESHKLMSHHRD